MLTITTPAFAHEAEIPMRYTQEGENLSPELVFSGVPANARSLVLLSDDPDAPELDTDMEVWAMVWRKAFAWGLWESIGLGILGLALLASVLLLGWEIAVTEPLLLLAGTHLLLGRL